MAVFGIVPGSVPEKFVQQRERIQLKIEKLLATGVSTFVMKEQSQPRKTTFLSKAISRDRTKKSRAEHLLYCHHFPHQTRLSTAWIWHDGSHRPTIRSRRG
jgi:hypothetical protein